MAKQCPRCKSLWDDEDRFCGDCGSPLRSVLVPGEAREGPGLPGPMMWLMGLFPGVFKPVVLVLSLLGIAFALFAFWLAVFILQLGGMISAFAIGGGGMLIYWTCVSWLLYGYIVVPVEAMTEFQGKHWMALVLATLIPGAAFLLLMKRVSGG